MVERAKELMRIERTETPDSPYQWLADLSRGQEETKGDGE